MLGLTLQESFHIEKVRLFFQNMALQNQKMYLWKDKAKF